MASRSRSETSKKLRAAYDYLQNEGQAIAPEDDVKFGLEKRITLNLQGSEYIEIPKEGYNSALLFTLITSVMNNGTIIYFGPPGAGKTTLAEYAGALIQGQTLDEIHRATIFGHPEQTQELMVARYSLADLMTGDEVVKVREFMNSPTKIIDEVNRLPPGKLSILYQLVDRGFTDYGDELIESTEGSLYLTANAADEGNYPLPKPFLDRIGAAVVVPQLNPCFISALDQRNGRRSNNNSLAQNNLKFTKREREDAREEIGNVSFGGNELYTLTHFLSETNYCYKAGEALESKTKGHAQFKKPGKGLCADCHYFSSEKKNDPKIAQAQSVCYLTQEGISPRTYKSIIAYTKAIAWWRGKKKAEIDDLSAAIPYCTWHKVTPTDTAFDKNKAHINDRIAFMRSVFDTCQQTYQRCKKVYDDYDKILETMNIAMEQPAKRAELQTEILKHFDNLQKIDSVAKYPLAVTLARAYRMLGAQDGT